MRSHDRRYSYTTNVGSQNRIWSTVRTNGHELKTGSDIILSVVVESEDMRDKIRHSAPEAIGGDMEGGKLLKLFKEKVEVVIKGVVHYADGNRADEWEFTTSMAALLIYVTSKLCYCQGE